MRKITLLIIILVVLEACTPPTGKLNEVVERYDQLLAEGYRNLNMDPLMQVATEGRVAKAHHHMAALKEAGVKMDSKLKKINFSDIKIISSGKAEVITDEEWGYKYIRLDSGNIEFDNSVTYRLKYFLEKHDNRWLVADIQIERAVEEKEFKGFFERPHDGEKRLDGQGMRHH